MSKKNSEDAPAFLPAPTPVAEAKEPWAHLSEALEGLSRRQADNQRAIHAGASALHGWPSRRDADETGDSCKFTADDYAKAIAAVDTFRPHPAALSARKRKG